MNTALVLDLIFPAGATIEPQALVTALGGEEIVASRQILDPDMQDPRFELEVSPSIPFRRRGERRLMVIDDSVSLLGDDPRAEPITTTDLRPEKDRLIASCQATGARLGRIMALGVWGSAVLVARTARDLRAISLISWALDPSMDLTGRRRATPLSQAEHEEKILAFDKRLDELSEADILASTGPATMVRAGDYIVLDVLEADGTWDVRKSLMMEMALAALDRFAHIVGAPASAPPENRAPAAPEPKPAPSPAPPQAEPPPAADVPKLAAGHINGRVVLLFPRARFDLDVAAAMGVNNWEAVLAAGDLSGAERDQVFSEGAGFIAPLEFLSEVFFEGKPLSRVDFDGHARAINDSARALEVHCPRYGSAVLLDVPGRGRFISSEDGAPEMVLGLLPEMPA